jgi:hypothetical protein
VAGLLVAAASIAFALTITPAQQVSVLGEQIGVATASPSLSLSGPGQADLFRQRLPTVIWFAGPVRPRLTLAHITLSRQLAATLSAQSGRRLVRLCAVASRCDNPASPAYFQRQLAAFNAHYYQLLGQLAALPSRPRILVKPVL